MSAWNCVCRIIVLIKFRALFWNVIAHIKRRYLLHGDGCISSFWELGSLMSIHSLLGKSNYERIHSKQWGTLHQNNLPPICWLVHVNSLQVVARSGKQLKSAVGRSRHLRPVRRTRCRVFHLSVKSGTSICDFWLPSWYSYVHFIHRPPVKKVLVSEWMIWCQIFSNLV